MQKIGDKYKIRIPCPDGEIGCAVCHYAFIDEDAYDQIHDCYYDTQGRKPSETVVALLYAEIPMDIKAIAIQWGWNDTEVRDKVYGWMKGRIILLL
ncbi:hypothetical protein Kirov_230 [Bacillus phage Kirov]|uniref:Uncharacterized protein n=1 Tax=Bacillus phage Kirov TaxID=2783539 RepID=A0A7S6RBE0_9CAUD|nr:hypothetical protein PQE67_gp074 [Bacillus phage Kirov]QOV08429.1 hypothetical protein Kirov_230 [Bacillus phage Kirov]